MTFIFITCMRVSDGERVAFETMHVDEVFQAGSGGQGRYPRNGRAVHQVLGCWFENVSNVEADVRITTCSFVPHSLGLVERATDGDEEITYCEQRPEREPGRTNASSIGLQWTTPQSSA
jgi:hypothetical protein